ncbi:LicD family protein [Ligilactobacillus ruminis]|nr:LicD family protein [Ligilactobacillus ruminis]
MENCESRKMTPDQLRKMQLTELDMLVEFDRVCRKYNIKYIIGSGTLLGAVRHKGFIPWDDDVDVEMLREDYEKFKRISNDLNEDICYFQCHDNEPEYLWGYGKLRHTNTVCVRGGQERAKWRTGIFIDIFPVDDIPKNTVCQRIQDVCCFFIRKIIYAHIGKDSAKGIKKGIYSILAKIPVERAHRYLKKFISKSNNTSDNNVRVLMFPLMKEQKEDEYWGFSKNFYLERELYEFEGYKLFGPKDYDDYLRKSYGDYMVLPPKDKRSKSSYYSYVRFTDGKTIIHK